MNEFLEGLITGIYIGACIGAVAMALMAAGSDDDDINGSGLEEGIVTWADICCNIEDLTGVKVDLLERLERKTGMIRET